uniref:Uncharacterized protein n=1 Tax=Anguilla anguilla TaxID=7936 RepID=A0A0E9WH91_ANGAN
MQGFVLLLWEKGREALSTSRDAVCCFSCLKHS